MSFDHRSRGDHGNVPLRTIRRRPVAALVALFLLVAALPPAGALAAGPTSSDLRAAERLVLTRINGEREERDLLPIRMDGRIQAVAQARSRDMVERGYFAHTDPDGLLPWDHLNAADITWWGAGEIIALNGVSPVSDAARRAVEQWMASPGHHAQIVSTTFNYAGVGVAMDGGVSYWTVVFIQGPDRTDPDASVTRATSPSGSRTALVRWHGSDARLATGTAGVASFDVQRRRVGGSWATIRTRATGTGTSVSGKRGVRYQFRVRARDRAGNVGDWSSPRSVTVR